jgi:uncharacterized protein
MNILGIQRANVPCGSCRLCCKGQSVPIMPELGDDPLVYKHHERVNRNGQPYLEIDHKPNGDCIYLDDDTGCTIHHRAPYLCRTFDCRQAYLMHNGTERRRRIKAGLASAAVYAAGRERLKR